MKHPDHTQHNLLHLLEQAKDCTLETIRDVAAQTGVPEADVYGVARFYDLLRRPGPRVCQGLSCAIAGGSAPEDHHSVSCLGRCEVAPVTVDTESRLSSSTEMKQVFIDDASLPINLGGQDNSRYDALTKAQSQGMDWVLEQITSSGLQGRGGAGFPAHIKWRAVSKSTSTTKYLVCNADEAEPGTFKDRILMERRPHLMLEGLAIAAEVIGSTEIYIYIRGEFPEAASAIEKALTEAGERLTTYNFKIVRGHGAYICGEETALLESIEGKRGMPRLKPPYPTDVGLWGEPTLINNVETLACVPAIIHRGGEWFKGLGRSEAGTKLYCVSGHVERPGVYELPLGATLDELVATAGGYVGTPAAFVPGGAASGFLPMSQRALPLDFGSLSKVGSMLGSAGVVVLNDSVNLARAALNQTTFFEDESCGQCAPCRIGTRYIRQRLERFVASGDIQDLEHSTDIAWEMEEGSICGLGITAGLPLTSYLKWLHPS